MLFIRRNQCSVIIIIQTENAEHMIADNTERMRDHIKGEVSILQSQCEKVILAWNKSNRQSL